MKNSKEIDNWLIKNKLYEIFILQNIYKKKLNFIKAVIKNESKVLFKIEYEALKEISMINTISYKEWLRNKKIIEFLYKRNYQGV